VAVSVGVGVGVGVGVRTCLFDRCQRCNIGARYRAPGVDPNSDHTEVVGDVGPRAAVGDDAIAERNQAVLGKGREREECDRDAQVGAGEDRAGGQVSLQ
jgi:hypothetical protein